MSVAIQTLEYIPSSLTMWFLHTQNVLPSLAGIRFHRTTNLSMDDTAPSPATLIEQYSERCVMGIVYHTRKTKASTYLTSTLVDTSQWVLHHEWRFMGNMLTVCVNKPVCGKVSLGCDAVTMGSVPGCNLHGVSGLSIWHQSLFPTILLGSRPDACYLLCIRHQITLSPS